MSVLSRALERGSVKKRAADLAQLHDLIAPVSGARLLDVGGGTGAATERFAIGCAEMVVLEPDRRKVAEGRRLRPAIRFVEGHAEGIPFPAGTFDRVTSVVAFHHMGNQERALEEMRRVLRDSGRIVLWPSVPMDRRLSSRRPHGLPRAGRAHRKTAIRRIHRRIKPAGRHGLLRYRNEVILCFSVWPRRTPQVYRSPRRHAG